MRRKLPKYQQAERWLRIIFIVFIIILAFFTYLVLKRASRTEQRFIQLNFIALLLGLVFEFIRISGKWSLVLWTAIGSYAFSFAAFFPGKNENEYIFENHLENWPYVFLGAFILVAMYSQYSKATQKLHEGITLLLTFSINYWIIANDYWSTGSVFVRVLIIINALISLISLFNALTYRELSKGMRLTLSLWSTIITLILSIDNFLVLYRYRDIEHLATFLEAALVFFQYFLLGVSSIYVAQNATMILAYLPGKQYLKSVREINEVHLERFSKEQVHITDSIIVAVISGIGFSLNYFYHYIPVNFLIWAMIVTIPLVLYPIHHLLYAKRV